MHSNLLTEYIFCKSLSFYLLLNYFKPKVGAERRVHVPNMSDLKKTDQYLLTSQEQSGDKIKTTLVKGYYEFCSVRV